MRLAGFVVLLAPAASAQWTTVHGFAPRGTLRFPFEAMGDRVTFATPDSLFSSLDGGATFVGRNIRTDIDPGNALQGGGTWDGDLLVGGTCPSRCLSRSSDGRTWTRVQIPTSGAQTVSGLAVGVAGRGDLLVVATAPTTGSASQSTMWISSDRGASWRRAATSSVPGAPNHLSIVAGRFFLVVDAAENTYLGRLYTSTDGDTWTEARVPSVGGTTEPMDRVDTVVESGGVLFASPSFGLHRSTDGGATWTIVATSGLGQSGTGYVTSLEGVGGGALAATFQDRHVRSTDFGATWTTGCPAYRQGFLSDDFEAASGFLLTRAGAEIARISYAACGLTAPVAAEDAPTSDALRVSVAPNPTAGQAMLRFTLAAPAAVRATVHDMLGRSLATVHDGPLAAGSHVLSRDVSGLAPGIYVVRLVAGVSVVSVPFSVAR